MKPVTAFNWVYTSASATGFRYLGAQPNEAALLYNNDLDSKISTGIDTPSTDFPEIMLAPICLIMNIRLSFWLFMSS